MIKFDSVDELISTVKGNIEWVRGKPLGACASWTIAFGPVSRLLGGSLALARPVPARLPLAFGSLLRLAPVSRFERFEKPSTSVGPAQAVRLVRNLSNQRDSLRKRFFLLKGKRRGGKCFGRNSGR